MGANTKNYKLWFDHTIDTMHGLRPDLEARDIDLAAIDTINIFGYGSLIDKPVRSPTSVSAGHLWDWRRDFCCVCTRSGTFENPGLTLGLNNIEGAITGGAILKYSGLPVEEKLCILDVFARREVPKGNPMYSFRILDIEEKDGTLTPAIVCVTNTEISSYFGDGLTEDEKQTLSPAEQEELSIQRKAHILAAAYSQERKGDHRTSKSYFDRFVRIPVELQRQQKPQEPLTRHQRALEREHDYIMRLAHATDTIRASLSPEQQELLHMIEAQALQKRIPKPSSSE